MFADYRFATAGGKPLSEIINDETWYRETYLGAVGKRGAAIIDARGLSSAASAANAAIDHIRDWSLGTAGKWVSMGIPSDGSYGVPEDVMFGVPVTCAGGTYSRVTDLPMDDFAKSRLAITLKELTEERDAVADLLK
jgi:malate dehydrogenase